MLYEFQEVGGTQVIERDYRMKDAPELGTVILVDGKAFQRILSASSQIDAGVRQIVGGYPYLSYQLPRETPGCEKVDRPGHHSHGRPIIRSRQHEREIGAALGMKRD